MASSKKIVVEVVGRDMEYASNGGGTSKQITDEDGQINLNSLLSPTKSSEKQILAKNIIVNKAIDDASSLIINGVRYAMSRRYTLSEDYIAQQEMSNTNILIDKIGSLGQAIIAGASIGGPIGAIVAGITWTATQSMEIAQRFDQAYLQVNEQNYESSFQRTRLGLNDNGRGTQN